MEKLAVLLLKNVNSNGTIAAYEAFLKRFSDTPAAEEARKALARLAYEAVVKENSIAAYKKFLENFPNSEMAEDAKQRLAPKLASHPICEVLGGWRVKVQFDSVELHARRWGIVNEQSFPSFHAFCRAMECFDPKTVMRLESKAEKVVDYSLNVSESDKHRFKTEMLSALSALLAKNEAVIVDTDYDALLSVRFDQWIAEKMVNRNEVQYSPIFVVRFRLLNKNGDVMQVWHAPGELAPGKWNTECLDKAMDIIMTSIGRSFNTPACSMALLRSTFATKKVQLAIEVGDVWNQVKVLQKTPSSGEVTMGTLEKPIEEIKAVAAREIKNALGSVLKHAGCYVVAEDGDITLAAAYSESREPSQRERTQGYAEKVFDDCYSLKLKLLDRKGRVSDIASFLWWKPTHVDMDLIKEDISLFRVHSARTELRDFTWKALPFLGHTLTKSEFRGRGDRGICVNQTAEDLTYGYGPDNPLRVLYLKEIGIRVYLRHLLDPEFRSLCSPVASAEELRIGNVGKCGDGHIVDVYRLVSEDCRYEYFLFVDLHHEDAAVHDALAPRNLYIWK